MNNSKTGNATGTEQHLRAAGLSSAALDVMVQNLDETVLMGCVGLEADAIDSAEATLVSVVLDMSGSMDTHRVAVVEAYNAMLTALVAAKSASSILVSTWAFNDAPQLLSSYETVDKKPRLAKSVYAPGGGTALYDATLHALTGLVAYGQELWDQGIPTRRVLFVLSDGDDNSSKAKAAEVRTLAESVLRQELTTLAYAGFGTTDPLAQAALLGFPDVVSTAASEGELRRVFRQVSQSVLRLSQGVKRPSAGGFF